MLQNAWQGQRAGQGRRQAQPGHSAPPPPPPPSAVWLAGRRWGVAAASSQPLHTQLCTLPRPRHLLRRPPKMADILTATLGGLAIGAGELSRGLLEAALSGAQVSRAPVLRGRSALPLL